IAVENQRGHIDLLQILREVGFRESLDALIDGLVSCHHPLEPERIAQALRDLGARPVGPVKGYGEVLEELGAISLHAGTDLVEHLHWQAARIRGRLRHQRRRRADEDSLGDALSSMTAEVASDFTAPCRMADVNRVFQVDRFGKTRFTSAILQGAVKSLATSAVMELSAS